ncbi:hypothetical protein [Galactobacter caseinivorans]|uniref:Uncharacterized protein n=1 Tax=Galactobacter caseinivorans TaxID=2676123 RepID=A0A496PMN9_9MICC|nr:hypothetical protein [Galactobacter caseinivorans]RKW71787.1 hypothetical protein DWQ67_02865 [Galactobacter caseinivorans]
MRVSQSTLPLIRDRMLSSTTLWDVRSRVIRETSWAGIKGFGSEQAGFAADMERLALKRAKLFVLGSEATSNVMEASKTLAGGGFHLSDLPSESGMLALSSAIPQTSQDSETRGFFGGIRVITWFTARGIDTSDSLWLVMQGLDELPSGQESYAKVLPLVHNDEIAVKIEGQPIDLVSADGAPRAIATVLLTAFLFMQQNELTTVKPTKVRVPHPKKPREQRTALVSVIDMRRYEPTPHTKSGDPRRTTDHRWVVSGHWRNQWYPSRNVHRPKWIPGHIKGPEGAPLRHVEKVHALRAVPNTQLESETA